MLIFIYRMQSLHYNYNAYLLKLIIINFVLSIGYLSMVMAGISIAWVAPLTAWFRSKNSEVLMTEQEVSWMISIVAIGTGVASIPCGMLADM